MDHFGRFIWNNIKWAIFIRLWKNFFVSIFLYLIAWNLIVGRRKIFYGLHGQFTQLVRILHFWLKVVIHTFDILGVSDADQRLTLLLLDGTFQRLFIHNLILDRLNLVELLLRNVLNQKLFAAPTFWNLRQVRALNQNLLRFFLLNLHL